jgi:hypothetical protein
LSRGLSCRSTVVSPRGPDCGRWMGHKSTGSRRGLQRLHPLPV